MTARRIGILGNGHVGSALARGLTNAKHDVRAVGNEPAKIRETASWAEIVILAVPFNAIDSVLKEAGSLDGKTVVDATNALGPEMQWALGFTTSGAEELQKKIPKARVVKAFNTVFAVHMDTGRVNNQQLTAFVAGNDADSKKSVLEIAGDIGFDAVDAGPLTNARLLEPLGYLNIQLGYVVGMGTQIGIKLLHDSKKK
ncbi:MAG TPA: NAD(P)-binding domain-containing protein [Acidisarcina sp.]|nr:NAD(P)-binding domain-containing protein [Acidisarcina sp.]